MKLDNAKKLVAMDIGSMSLEELQRHKVKLNPPFE